MLDQVSSPSFPLIFISYRRDDKKDFAVMLAEKLREAFGPNAVFLDIQDIVPGRPFPDEIREAIKTASLVLALIGPRWNLQENGRFRLDDPEDWVRTEVELALNLNKHLIPVRFDGKNISEIVKGLPDSMSKIGFLHFIKFNVEDGGYHFEKLFKAIEKFGIPRVKKPTSLIKLAIPIVVLVAIWVLWVQFGDKNPSKTVIVSSNGEPVWAFIKPPAQAIKDHFNRIDEVFKMMLDGKANDLNPLDEFKRLAMVPLTDGTQVEVIEIGPKEGPLADMSKLGSIPGNPGQIDLSKFLGPVAEQVNARIEVLDGPHKGKKLWVNRAALKSEVGLVDP